MITKHTYKNINKNLNFVALFCIYFSFSFILCVSCIKNTPVTLPSESHGLTQAQTQTHSSPNTNSVNVTTQDTNNLSSNSSTETGTETNTKTIINSTTETETETISNSDSTTNTSDSTTTPTNLEPILIDDSVLSTKQFHDVEYSSLIPSIDTVYDYPYRYFTDIQVWLLDLKNGVINLTTKLDSSQYTVRTPEQGNTDDGTYYMNVIKITLNKNLNISNYNKIMIKLRIPYITLSVDPTYSEITRIELLKSPSESSLTSLYCNKYEVSPDKTKISIYGMNFQKGQYLRISVK